MIRSTLPLDMETLRTVIVTPDVSVEVDYANSRLKGVAALIYLTNTALPNVSLDMTGVSDEERYALVDAYIMHKGVLNIPSLVDSLMVLLLTARNVEVPVELEALAIIKSADMSAFDSNSEREQHLDHLIRVVGGLPFFAFTCAKAFDDIFGDPRTAFPSVNDVNYVGYTFVHLVTHPMILDVVATTNDTTYFVQQYDENIYGGKSLFSYLAKSPILAVTDCLVSGAVTIEQLEQAVAEMTALENA